tara:strand:+ start:1040 stop:1408 length:369 start_codon:yes stop_codon:yes gene_type:complete
MQMQPTPPTPPTPSTRQLVEFAWNFYLILHKVHRVNPTLYEVMMLVRVEKAGEQGITANELVQDIGMSKASVSRWVADFVGRGILEQRKGVDGRSSMIHQTPASIARMERWADDVRGILSSQ